MVKKLRIFLQWYRFLRVTNLLLIVFIFLVLRWMVMAPLLEDILPGAFHLAVWEYMLMALDVMIVTASGYLVNDLYDQQTDICNGKKNLGIGILISSNGAWAVYLAMVIVGFCLSFWLGYRLNYLAYLPIYPIVVVVLWIYASVLKSTVIWGNAVVALFTASVPLLVLLAEWPTINILKSLNEEAGHKVVSLFFYFALFAFLLNFSREVVKDLEDLEGDKSSGLKTLPAVYGPMPSKVLAILFILMALAGTVYVFIKFSSLSLDITLLFGSGLSILLSATAIHTLFSSKPRDFGLTSKFLKICMLLGLVYLGSLSHG